MTKTKITIIAVAICFVLGVFVWKSCGSTPDPAGYVQSTLDLTFQGEIEGAKAFVNASGAELNQIYENGIKAFASQYLIGDIDSDGLYTKVYETVVKEIFRVQRYKVHEDVQELGEGQYLVTISYEPVDVFARFIPMLQEESQKIQQAMNMGAYTGTDEEKLEAALRDYLEFAGETLEMCYLEMEYGELSTMNVTVQENPDGTMEVQNNGVNTFIEAILDLDNR